MKAPTDIVTRRKGCVWGATLSVFVGLLLWIASLLDEKVTGFSFKGLANVGQDILFLVKSPTVITNIAIVTMDEESHSRLGQSSDRLWDRALHARLLDTLLARGARVVVFDVVFADAWPDPQVDARLAEALRRGQGKVVLAASLSTFEQAGQVGGSQVLQPVEQFAALAPFGVVEVPKDADGVLRRHPDYLHQTHLSWKSAGAAGASVPEPERRRWINYYGPLNAIRQISYWQALQPETLAPDIFSNKVIFVGKSRILTPRGISPADEYPTPYTRWTGHLLSGVEIQATLFLNLWRGDWLERLPRLAEAALLVVCGGLFGFGLARLRPLPALGAAVGGAALVGAVALTLLSVERLWFPWLIVAGAQIPVALIFSVLGFVSRAKEIPDHVLLRRVGRGAYGEVWLARDAIGGFHAVKIISRKNFPKAAPFEREFRGIQNFAPISRSHPGLVHILHAGRNDVRGCFYYIMEAADDEISGAKIVAERYSPRTLAGEIARRGRLPARECVRLAVDLVSALDHLHQHGLVHRDVKPANIIFVNGQLKIADVGLVTSVEGEAGELARIGTSGYLAPEGQGTAAADLFALGKTIYEAATGNECGRFPELPENLSASTDADVLVRLHEILLTACETDPADRYASAAAMHAALRELAAALDKSSISKV